MWQKEFTKVLNSQFQALKKRNHRYSVRAFGKKIGLSIGPLSVVLKGKQSWNLTPKRAAAILEKLGLKPNVRNRLLVQMGELPLHHKEKLPRSDFDILTNWKYYPVLFSFDLALPLRQPAKIAERLGTSELKVNAIVEDLLQRKLLHKSDDGTIKRPEIFLTTTDGPPNEKIQKYHELGIETSKRALEEIPLAKRDFTALTFAGSEKHLTFLKQEIRKLYEKASSLASGEEDNDTVYRMSVHLHPMEFSKK